MQQRGVLNDGEELTYAFGINVGELRGQHPPLQNLLGESRAMLRLFSGLVFTAFGLVQNDGLVLRAFVGEHTLDIDLYLYRDQGTWPLTGASIASR